MLHDPLTACSLEVTWQIKNKVSILLRDLWLLNLTGRWRMIRVTHPYCLMILWPCSYVRSRGKLKAQYLLFHKDYDYQAFQGSHLWWSKLSHNVKWLSEHVKTKTWQTKIVITPLSEGLRPLNLAVWWLIMRETHP